MEMRQRSRRAQGQRNPGTKKHGDCLCGGRELRDVGVSGRTRMPDKAINASRGTGGFKLFPDMLEQYLVQVPQHQLDKCISTRQVKKVKRSERLALFCSENTGDDEESIFEDGSPLGAAGFASFPTLGSQKHLC